MIDMTKVAEFEEALEQAVDELVSRARAVALTVDGIEAIAEIKVSVEGDGRWIDSTIVRTPIFADDE